MSSPIKGVLTLQTAGHATRTCYIHALAPLFSRHDRISLMFYPKIYVYVHVQSFVSQDKLWFYNLLFINTCEDWFIKLL